jgi:hypothetical protein
VLSTPATLCNPIEEEVLNLLHTPSLIRITSKWIEKAPLNYQSATHVTQPRRLPVAPLLYLRCATSYYFQSSQASTYPISNSTRKKRNPHQQPRLHQSPPKMANFLASIFGTELDKVNCSFYFVSSHTRARARPPPPRAKKKKRLHHANHHGRKSAPVVTAIAARENTSSPPTARPSSCPTCTRIPPTTPRTG